MSQLESETNLARFDESAFPAAHRAAATRRVAGRGRPSVEDRLPAPRRARCLLSPDRGGQRIVDRDDRVAPHLVVAIEQIVRQLVRDRRPDGPVLFPMIYVNPDGTHPISRAAYAAKLTKWLLDCDVRDESGAPVTPTPHQFRHTYVPRHVVKKLLDHDSDTMTAPLRQSG